MYLPVTVLTSTLQYLLCCVVCIVLSYTYGTVRVHTSMFFIHYSLLLLPEFLLFSLIQPIFLPFRLSSTYLTVFSLLFRSPSAYFYYIPLWHNSHLPALLSYSLESLPLCHSYPTICLSFPSVYSLLPTPFPLFLLSSLFPYSLHTYSYIPPCSFFRIPFNCCLIFFVLVLP